MRLLAVALLALALAGPASAADTQNLTKERAERIFLRNDKVADWLDRYPEQGRTVDAEYRKKTDDWEVEVWWGSAGEIAKGPGGGQARHGHGGLDRPAGGMEDGPRLPRRVRRQDAEQRPGVARIVRGLLHRACRPPPAAVGAEPRSARAAVVLDLAAVLQRRRHLHERTTGVSAARVPAGAHDVDRLSRPDRRVGAAGLAGLAAGSRDGFPRRLPDRAQRDAAEAERDRCGLLGRGRRAPHRQRAVAVRHFPASDDSLRACGEPDADGEVRDRVQTNGRCESANERGDTYGPVAYVAYVPAYLLLGWGGKWDALPTAHATSIAFDLAALALLGLVGLRFGGYRLGVTLAFAWASYPFTQYVLSSNTNDAIPPVLLLLGFLMLGSAWARGAPAALAAWTKFGSLLVVPLWSGYPRALELRSLVRFAAGFAIASAAAFSILLLEPDVLHAARVFWDRTLGWQLGRDSPFSIWGWGQYHADGVPDLAVLQKAVIGLVALGAVALAFVPRRRTPLAVAALTGAVLIGFQLTLTHWFYLYIPWFFPFVALAVLAPRPARTPQAAEVEQRDRPSRELVAAG